MKRPDTARPGKPAAALSFKKKSPEEEEEEEDDGSMTKVIVFESFAEPKKLSDMSSQELIVKKNLIEQEILKGEKIMNDINKEKAGVEDAIKAQPGYPSLKLKLNELRSKADATYKTILEHKAELEQVKKQQAQNK